MKTHSMFWLLVFLGCNGEKTLKIDVYPGFGWDHLRFLDMAPLYDVSNFNDSDGYQSCIEMIPLHENKIEMGSTEIDTFDSRTSDYSSNMMIGGSAGYGGFKIGGSYSKEYQTVKKEQSQEKTITLRNEIDYLMVDVILQPSCPLHPQVKKDLIEIAKYQSNNQSLMATYLAQLFVKKYGTHFVSRLYLGGSIIEEDFISRSNYQLSTADKNTYKAAAEASFLGTFSLSASFSSGSAQSQSAMNEYKKRIERKVVNSKGGDVFILGGHMEAWQASVKKNPAIIRRAIENITYFIHEDKLPELTEIALTKVRKVIDEAVNTYVEMNTIRGCMNRDSPSFNWIANVDDSSCAPVQQTTQFGGFIRTCSEDSRMQKKCSTLQKNNSYTGNDQCKYDFNKYLLHTSIQYEPLYRQNCWKCGFLWLSKCCENVYIGEGRRDLNLYGCNRNVSQQLGSYDSASIQSTYVFGGSYTEKKVNPVNNNFDCPQGLSKADDIGGITVCLAERFTSNPKILPRYGGIYSCQYGNIAIRSRAKGCSEGYSSYAMGTIDGDCFLDVCLKFEKLDDLRGLPVVAIPPFFQIDTAYAIVDTNETTENDTISGRMISSRHFIGVHTSSALQSNHIKFGSVIAALCVGMIHHIASLV